MREIGFVVWGVRSGFKNNWLTSNVDSSVLSALTDEMRIYCHGTVTQFLSIEKVNNFNVVTIYNPNTTDHVGRRAYMAISIVVPKSYGLTGNVIGCMEELMATYSSKQGNAMVNKVSSGDFESILAKITPTVNSKIKLDGAEKVGIFKTTDFNSCNIHFQDLTICEYKKVYFLKESITALEKKEGVESIRSFRRPNLFIINGFNSQLHEITINDKKVQGSKHVIFSGDAIKLTHLGQKIARRRVAGDRDIVINMATEFPPKIAPPKPVKDQRSSRKKVVLTSVALFIIGAVTILSYFNFFGSNEVTETRDTQKEEKAPEATFDLKSKTLSITNAEKWSEFYIPGDTEKKGNINVDIGEFSDTSITLDRKKDTLLVLSGNENEVSDTIDIKFYLPIKHLVKKKQTLSKIAAIYGIDVKELKSINDLKNDNLSIDQILTLIPETIKVEGKQTLQKISKKYEIDIEYLKEINELDNYNVDEGDILKLRVSADEDQVTDKESPNAAEKEDKIKGTNAPLNGNKTGNMDNGEEQTDNKETNPPTPNVKKETNKKSGQETQNKAAENIEELREDAIALLNTLSKDCPSLKDQEEVQLAKIEEATSREELETYTTYMKEICSK
jgi:LysM repeat protein